MLNGEIRSQIDKIRNDLWSGGVSNPLTGVEQITNLLFIKRLDEIQSRREAMAQGLGKPVENPIFPEGKDGRKSESFDEEGCPYELMRWSRFKNEEPMRMMEIVDEHVFPFLQTLGGEGSSMARHMKGARLAFGSSKAALLDKLVQGLDAIQMNDRDTKGDVYEYMLSKIASAGENGQFRTPRHIIELMVHMVAPTPADTICDPAAGTAGFLVVASEYLRTNHPELFKDDQKRQHFEKNAFSGFDFDETMLRIGAMNMMLHGIEDPNIADRDSLSEVDGAEKDAYTVILANPPFKGSLDADGCSKDLLKVVKTKKTELLFMALFLKLLTTGGRAAVIVPDGILFGSSKAHRTLRQTLVEEHQLQGIVKMPSGVFKPYAGVSTAILLFTKTGVGGTDHVWFYDMQADGLSLDDKRTELLVPRKLGVVPDEPLEDGDHCNNNLPDILARWQDRTGSERDNPATAQSFCVVKADIVEADYDLSLNRYKEVEYEEIKYDKPAKIIGDLRDIEKEIARGLNELEASLR